MSVIGAFSAVDGLSIRVFEDTETVKGEDFTLFVEAIAKNLKGKQDEAIYFIFDNCSVHMPAELDRVLKKQSAKFRVVFLPPYSPRLNPIEQVWNALKAQVKHEALTDGESVRHALTAGMDKLDRNSFPRYFEHMQREIYPLALAHKPMH